MVASGRRRSPREGRAPRRKCASRRAGPRSRRERECWNDVRRALILTPVGAHITRSVRDSALPSAQSPHNPRASPPRAPNPSSRHLAPSAVEVHIAPRGRDGRRAGRNRRRTLAQGPLDADLACTACRALERADVLDGASVPSLFPARREAEYAQARRPCAVVGMPAAFAFPARTRGHPTCFCRPPLLPVRVPARRTVLPLHFQEYRARAYLCSTRRTMVCAATSSPRSTASRRTSSSPRLASSASASSNLYARK
jgi:hypothetical protein